jgi:hypothetical protein
MSKPAKSVGDVWLLCREPQALAVKLKRDFKIEVVTVRVKGGEYIHIPAKTLPKTLLAKINDPEFRIAHGIIQIHFEQPVKAFDVGTGE